MNFDKMMLMKLEQGVDANNMKFVYFLSLNYHGYEPSVLKYLTICVNEINKSFMKIASWEPLLDGDQQQSFYKDEQNHLRLYCNVRMMLNMVELPDPIMKGIMLGMIELSILSCYTKNIKLINKNLNFQQKYIIEEMIPYNENNKFFEVRFQYLKMRHEVVTNEIKRLIREKYEK